MIKAVIFDMDGVLIDTEKYLVKFWCQAAKEFGFPMKPEHGMFIRSLAGKYAEPKLKEIFGETFDYNSIRTRRKELMEEHIAQHGIEKKPKTDELLLFLKEHGLKTAVATATDETRAETYLKLVGLYDKFDRIICATMVENGKPKPDVYLYACRQLGEKPEDCIAVEDSPNGVLSASSAGLRTIMVPDLSEPDFNIEKLLYRKAADLGELMEEEIYI